MISGPAAAWLAGRRQDLNARFERTRRRHPHLDPARFAELLEAVLPPLAEPAPGSEDLLSAVYDLVLLHAARDALATHPGLDVLLRKAFPQLRALLLDRPSTLPGALSNAVEGLGHRGLEFARRIAGVGTAAGGPAQLLAAGSVLAWRLGEVRLRDEALRVAAALPSPAVLAALDLTDWPDEATPLALAALHGDAWLDPRDRVAEATLRSLRGVSPEQVKALSMQLERPSAVPLGEWRVVSRIGDFSGFGGCFETPPVVLDGGDRHLVYARSGTTTYRLDADVFGWSYRVDTDVDLSVRTAVGAQPALKRLFAKLAPARDHDRVRTDGTVELGAEKARFAALAGVNAFMILPQAVATTHPDSHRIRILAPRRVPV